MGQKNILCAPNLFLLPCKLSCQLGYTMENVEKKFKLGKKISFEYILVKKLKADSVRSEKES